MIKDIKEYNALLGKWATLSFSPEEDVRVEKELKRFEKENADLLRKIHEDSMRVKLVKDPKTNTYHIKSV